MEKIRLGRTGLLVTKTAFGALPIQRISKADAVKLVRPGPVRRESTISTPRICTLTARKNWERPSTTCGRTW